MSTCNYCKRQVVKGKYCSVQCQANERRTIATQQWLRKKIPGHKGVAMIIKDFVRAYMIEKAGGKCSKCGWNTPHPISKKPPLEINHIDGNASNSWEENLEVLCPNCHSLTSNFKNRNKGNCKRNRSLG